MKPTLALSLFASLTLAACGGDTPKHPTGTHTHADGTVHKDEPAPPAGAHGHEHGERIELGTIKVGEHTISVFQMAKIEAGKEAEFDLDFAEGKSLPATVRGWIGIESAKGSMKVKFEKETEARMHGHLEAPGPIPAGSMLWIEIEGAGGTSKASVAYQP